MNWLLAAAPTIAAAGEFHPHEPVMVFPALAIDNLVIGEWFVMAILTVLAILFHRVLTKLPNTRIQNFFELLTDALEVWLASFIGNREAARKHMPLLGSLFLFILFSNYSGLLPSAGETFSFFPPTGKWGTTAGLGIVVMIAVNLISLKELGVKEHFKHLFEVSYGPMAILMGPLRIVEEFVRPFSLSLRLFGNIFAEEMLLGVMIWLAPYFVPVPIMGLSLIFAFMQALVFVTLTAIYIGGVVEARAHLHHGHDDEGPSVQHAGLAPGPS